MIHSDPKSYSVMLSSGTLVAGAFYPLFLPFAQIYFGQRNYFVGIGRYRMVLGSGF